MHPQAAIPSPTHSVWHLGPLPLRGYALCIVAGIILAVWLTDRRWRQRGGDSGDVADVAGWAIVFGILGGRIYHVITDPELYFKHGEDAVNALKIWDGGLGIPGAIALGTLGAWIGCRRHGMKLSSFGDAAVPGVAFAQALGRWGNWFNNELYGRATTLPWKLQIHQIDVESGNPTRDATGKPIVLGYFQPTFLYESLWDAGLAVLLLVIDRRYKIGRGRLFALYAMGYAVGRFWVELLRSDHANHIFGQRVNTWIMLFVFLGGLAWLLTHRGPREESVRTRPGKHTPDQPADEPAPDTGEDADQPDEADSEAVAE
ncbi:MAG: prolipoprotein diacylglyceryl transferase [Jatrophihabitans sp.]